jgi:hypothetical protein
LAMRGETDENVFILADDLIVQKVKTTTFRNAVWDIHNNIDESSTTEWGQQ